MNSASRIFFFLLFLFGVSAAQTADVKIPVEPGLVDPALSSKKPELKNVKETLSLPAAITFASGNVLRGSLRFVAKDMVISGKDTHDGRSRRISLEEISGLGILRWQGRKEKGGSYVFYPALAALSLKSGDVYRIGSLEQFYRLYFTYAGHESMIYSYFYVQRDKNGWVGYGNAPIDYPETHPHNQTVVEIRFFEKTSETQPAQDLLKYFLK